MEAPLAEVPRRPGPDASPLGGSLAPPSALEPLLLDVRLGWGWVLQGRRATASALDTEEAQEGDVMGTRSQTRLSLHRSFSKLSQAPSGPAPVGERSLRDGSDKGLSPKCAFQNQVRGEGSAGSHTEAWGPGKVLDPGRSTPSFSMLITPGLVGVLMLESGRPEF